MPPVMYSQPCGPIPSTTASAPELRTANRIPARPTRCKRPPVAPYRQVLPAMASPPARGAEVRFRRDRDRAARQAFRDVVVGLPDEAQFDAPARRTLRTNDPPHRAARSGKAHGARHARARRLDPPRPNGPPSSRGARRRRRMLGHGARPRCPLPAPTPAPDGCHDRRTWMSAAGGVGSPRSRPDDGRQLKPARPARPAGRDGSRRRPRRPNRRRSPPARDGRPPRWQ